MHAAPSWGLTRGSNLEHIVTATLQSIALQTFDLIHAMRDDGVNPPVIRVDGGMVANDWFLQFLADVLETPVERPENVESTVLGAAFLAAYQAGVLTDAEQIADHWQLDARFEPAMSEETRIICCKGGTRPWDGCVAMGSTSC